MVVLVQEIPISLLPILDSMNNNNSGRKELSDFEVKHFNLKFASKFKFYVQVGSSTVDRGGAVIQNLVGIRVSHIEVEISL